jgi:hypothetical protein
MFFLPNSAALLILLQITYSNFANAKPQQNPFSSSGPNVVAPSNPATGLSQQCQSLLAQTRSSIVPCLSSIPGFDVNFPYTDFTQIPQQFRQAYSRCYCDQRQWQLASQQVQICNSPPQSIQQSFQQICSVAGIQFNPSSGPVTNGTNRYNSAFINVPQTQSLLISLLGFLFPLLI